VVLVQTAIPERDRLRGRRVDPRRAAADGTPLAVAALAVVVISVIAAVVAIGLR